MHCRTDTIIVHSESKFKTILFKIVDNTIPTPEKFCEDIDPWNYDATKRNRDIIEK